MVNRSDGMCYGLGVRSAREWVRVPYHLVVDNVLVHEEGVAAIHATYHSKQECCYGALYVCDMRIMLLQYSDR